MNDCCPSSGGFAAAADVSSEPVGGVGEERRSLPPTLIIIIAAYNESAAIARVVQGALRHAPVIVVDDGSTDDTAARAEAAGAEAIRHRRRLGKGQAIRTGLAAAAARGAAVVITLDGDGQHDPADIPRLCAAAEPGALVIGGRLGETNGFGSGRLNAVRVAGFFVNWVTGLHVEDTQSGFRLYPLPLVRELPTRRGGFVFETEVLVEAARRGLTVREVPVSASPRTAQRSRFRPLVDGVLIAAYLGAQTMRRWLVETRASRASIRAWGVNRWWRHPGRQRLSVAASGTVLSPVLLGLAIGQSLVGTVTRRIARRPAPDFVSPVVTRWFSQSKLVSLDSGAAGGAAIVTNDQRPAAAASFVTNPGVPS